MNQNIINQFELLIKQIKFDIDFTTGKQQMINMYRLQSVEKVLKILQAFPKKITKSEQLANIKNVGKKSLMRIDEILKFGKLNEIKFSGDIEKYLSVVAELDDIFGIGRKKAYELFTKHNITSIAELQKKYNKGEIVLPDVIAKGLKYIGQIKDKIPRSEIDEYNEIFMTLTAQIDPKLFGVVCGSYRRQLPTSGDIDFIMFHSDVITKKHKSNVNYIQKFVTALKQKNIIIDSFTEDDVETKYMGISKLGKYSMRRLDIRFVPYESYYPAILYFTGSKDLNKKMRSLAMDMNYLLNEYGLFDENKKMIKVKSENEIFEILGLEFLTPDKR